MQAKRLKTGVRGSQFHFVAPAENSFQSCAGLIDQRHDDFSITRFIATFDQRDVAVANVLIDHRVAFHTQRVDALWSNSAEQKTWYTDRFRILNRVNRNAR